MPDPTPGNVFGPIGITSVIEQQVSDGLKDWLSMYLAEVERRVGVDEGTYPRPRTWNVSIEADTFPAEQLPALVVVSSGIAEDPVRRGNGSYDAWYTISVAVAVTTPNERSSRALAGVYAAAVRTCLLQQQPAGTMDWVGERIDGVEGVRNRTLGMCQVDFRVKVDGVVQANAGPTYGPVPPLDGPPEDPLEPLDDWGEVTEVHIDLDEHPITEDL